MAITSITQTRHGVQTIVTAASDLAGTVYLHWYLDGVLVASGTSTRRAFTVVAGDRIRVDVVDTTDPNFDPIANAPAGYAARRRLWWLTSLDADVLHYRVEQQKDGGTWSTVATVPHDGRWAYTLVTARLVDLASYAWRIVPVDRAGNDGTILTIGPQTIVRTPDAPNFTATFDPATTKVTFASAA